MKSSVVTHIEVDDPTHGEYLRRIADALDRAYPRDNPREASK